MATYEVNVKSYKRCVCYEVGCVVRSMTCEQRQRALNLISDRVAKARLLGQRYDVGMLGRVVKALRAN